MDKNITERDVRPFTTGRNYVQFPVKLLCITIFNPMINQGIH
ncbi:hypothetical protein [Colwellia psychrerythraea]|nr:hypothetical protein [Colwellia psychrerythraea]